MNKYFPHAVCFCLGAMLGGCVVFATAEPETHVVIREVPVAPAVESEPPEPAGDDPAEPAPRLTLTVSAKGLLAAFEKNEVAADDQFSGRNLQVRGNVLEIGKTMLGEPFVTLGDEDSLAAVQCMFTDGASIKKLNRGEEVRIVGECSGKTINVVLWDCKLVE